MQACYENYTRYKTNNLAKAHETRDSVSILYLQVV